MPPPAPAIECKGGEYIKLKTNYEYKTNLSIFKMALLAEGDFDILQFAHAANKTIEEDGRLLLGRDQRQEVDDGEDDLPSRRRLII